MENCTIRIKYLHDRACEWARWVGFAAAKQYEAGHVCDHDTRTETFRRSSGGLCSQPTLPKEARIIRRFPWAGRSMGTQEHRELQADSDGTDNIVGAASTVDIALSARVRAEQERSSRAQRVQRFCERFANTGHSKGTRCTPTNFVPEKDEWLPTNMAMGHAMHTVGMHPEQFYWCEKCGAHTNERVKALKVPCKNRQGNPGVADKLRRGIHPYKGTRLLTGTRRMTLEDVGYVPDGGLPCGVHTDPSPLEALATLQF